MNSYRKYLRSISKSQVVSIWLGFPMKEKIRMILKQFKRDF